MEEDPWYGEFWREDNGNFKWEIINNRHDYEYFGIHNQISTQNPFKFWIHIEGLPLYEKNYDETYSRANICIPKAQNLLNDLLFQKNFNGLYLNKDELEDFLLNLRLPLPAFWFKGSPVNTERFCAGQCIDSDFDIAKQIKEKTGEIQEWRLAKPITVTDRMKKEEKILELAQEMDSLLNQIGKDSHHDPSLPGHKDVYHEDDTDTKTFARISKERDKKRIISHLVKEIGNSQGGWKEHFKDYQLGNELFPGSYDLNNPNDKESVRQQGKRYSIAGKEIIDEIGKKNCPQDLEKEAQRIFQKLSQSSDAY